MDDSLKAKFREMLQDYVNADRATLLAIAQKSAAALIPVCKELDKENNGVFLLTQFVIAAMGADGILTIKEKEFIAEALYIDTETVSKFTKLYSPKVFDFVNEAADKLGGDIKRNIVALTLCICACDEEITRTETEFIVKLFD